MKEIQIDVLNQNSRIEYVSNFISMSINKVSRKDISASYLVLQIKEINLLNASDVEVYWIKVVKWEHNCDGQLE